MKEIVVEWTTLIPALSFPRPRHRVTLGTVRTIAIVMAGPKSPSCLALLRSASGSLSSPGLAEVSAPILRCFTYYFPPAMSSASCLSAASPLATPYYASSAPRRRPDRRASARRGLCSDLLSGRRINGRQHLVVVFRAKSCRTFSPERSTQAFYITEQAGSVKAKLSPALRPPHRRAVIKKSVLPIKSRGKPCGESVPSRRHTREETREHHVHTFPRQAIRLYSDWPPNER